MARKSFAWNRFKPGPLTVVNELLKQGVHCKVIYLSGNDIGLRKNLKEN